MHLHAPGEKIGGRLVVRGVGAGNTLRAVRTTASWPSASWRIISFASGEPSLSAIEVRFPNSR